MNAKKVATLLAQHAEPLALQWYPAGVREGQEWRVGALSGEAGRSLCIHLNGAKAGYWCDFATGERGDLLELWRLHHNITLREALQQARAWLGITTPQFHAYATRQYVRPQRPHCHAPQPQSAVMHYLTQERQLTSETLKQFHIAEQGRTIIFPYLREGELLQVKYLALDRPQGKKQIRVEANCEPSLFGWQALSPDTRVVALTEGEIDAMTLHQYGIPALSLPYGGGKGAKHQWIEHEYDRLSLFDEIYLCMDNDSAGQEAERDLIQRLGNYRCKVVQLPYKDANECLQHGMTTAEIKTYFQNAQIMDPVELKSAALYVESVLRVLYPAPDSPTLGYTVPWAQAKKEIRLRPGELSIWSGINGHGKSQFLGQIALHCMQQGARVCIASLEMTPDRLLARLTRQAAGLRQPSEDYVRAIHTWYGDKLWLFDLVGSAKVDRLLEVFLYARQRYNVDVFIIDSLMKCGLPEEEYNPVKAFIEQLCDFKNTHPCHIHLISHPRKAADENHMPGKMDIKGTGAVADLADNCFMVWRNKLKERAREQSEFKAGEIPLEIQKKPDCVWRCDKQRNGEYENKYGLWFDRDSFQYTDHYTKKPIRYVQYSKLEPPFSEVTA